MLLVCVRKLALLVGSLALARSLAAGPDEACSLGSWLPLGDKLHTWKYFDPACQHANLIQELAPAACAVSGCKNRGVFADLRQAWKSSGYLAARNAPGTRPRPHPVKIFVVGDSIDRYIGMDLCSLFDHPLLPFAARGIFPCDELHIKKKGPEYHTCIACKLPGLVYAKESLWSVHMSGPLEHNLSGFAHARAKQGLAQFRREFGEPDLVVLSSNLWDVGRWHTIDYGGWTEILPPMLPFSFLEGWITNMTKVVQKTKENLPAGASIAIRTSLPPDSYLQPDGRLLIVKLGYQAHYAQLAEAARYVARKEKVHLVDLYSMYLMMNNHTEYLRDGVHGAISVGMEVVNHYLNIVRRQDLDGDSQGVIESSSSDLSF